MRILYCCLVSSILINFISSHYLPEVNCLYFYFLALHKNTVSCPVSVFVTLVHSENWIIFREKLGKNTNKPGFQPIYTPYLTDRKNLPLCLFQFNRLATEMMKCLETTDWDLIWYPRCAVFSVVLQQMCDLLMSEYYWIHWHSASLHPRWQLVVIVPLPTSHLRLPTTVINIKIIISKMDI